MVRGAGRRGGRVVFLSYVRGVGAARGAIIPVPVVGIPKATTPYLRGTK
jgi:hypothetical protein